MKKYLDTFEDDPPLKLAEILCLATQEILALRYDEAIRASACQFQARSKKNAWATYYMPPQARRKDGVSSKIHIIQFGSRCVNSFFDQERLTKNAQDDEEVRTYGRLAKYGPLTPAVALSFLVLHEFAHFLVHLDGYPREGHGPRFHAKLRSMHDANDGVLVAAFLRSQGSKIGVDLDAFFVPITEKIPFSAGDSVTWTDKHGVQIGTVVRVNRQSLTLLPDHGKWKTYAPPSAVQLTSQTAPSHRGS